MIRPTIIEDIPNILSIRNDERTRIFLDDDRIFSVEEGLNWFKNINPIWYSIIENEVLIGYIRTFKENNSICVGCDIHPDHRRKGHANHALNWIIVKSLNEGIDDIWLQCFEDNTKAISLYKRLGFIRTKNLITRGKNALKMQLNVQKGEVDFLTVFNKAHVSDYLQFFNDKLEKLGSGTIKVNYRILKEGVDLNQGSYSHYLGIQSLIKDVNSDNFVIFDYDTCLLCKNWDKILSFLMNQYVAIGTEYPHSYKKYINFPTLFFSAWDTSTWINLKPDLNPDAPFDKSLHFYSNAEKFDIGNSLPTTFKSHRSLTWSFREHLGIETYFCYDLPFITHLGRGTTRDFSHPRNIEWRKTIDDFY